MIKDHPVQSSGCAQSLFAKIILTHQSTDKHAKKAHKLKN